VTVYATTTELTNYLGEDEYLRVADRDGSGVVDSDAVTLALSDASSIADSYLTRWLPITDIPSALRRAVMAIAVYSLAGNTQTDDQRRRYEDAIAWLRDVASARASLGIPPADVSSSAGSIAYSTGTRVMTRTALGRVL
jgi:phage gp36-like protein